MVWCIISTVAPRKQEVLTIGVEGQINIQVVKCSQEVSKILTLWFRERLRSKIYFTARVWGHSSNCNRIQDETIFNKMWIWNLELMRYTLYAVINKGIVTLDWGKQRSYTLLNQGVILQYCIITIPLLMSGIGAVVKVVDSHFCGWGSIPGKNCCFLIVSLSNDLSLCFMCVYNTGCLVGFPWLAVCYWITTLNNTYTHTHTLF